MRRTLLACLSLSAVLGAQTLQDFSGAWRVDPKQIEEKASAVNNPPADAPAVPPPPPPNYRYTPEQIRWTGDVLKISGGEAGTTAIYTIDPSGKQVSDPIPDAPGSIRVASTHWNNGKLVTEWKMERNGVTFMHGADTRSLTTDGRQILERVIESPRHKATVRLVLERAK